jgi:hypothetical protein
MSLSAENRRYFDAAGHYQNGTNRDEEVQQSPEDEEDAVSYKIQILDSTAEDLPEAEELHPGHYYLQCSVKALVPEKEMERGKKTVLGEEVTFRVSYSFVSKREVGSTCDLGVQSVRINEKEATIVFPFTIPSPEYVVDDVYVANIKALCCHVQIITPEEKWDVEESFPVNVFFSKKKK